MDEDSRYPANLVWQKPHGLDLPWLDGPLSAPLPRYIASPVEIQLDISKEDRQRMDRWLYGN